MAVIADSDVMEHVGQIDMRIRCGDRTPESDERWRNRSGILAAWLVEQWNRQRQTAEMN